jgi:hypothetical protein
MLVLAAVALADDLQTVGNSDSLGFSARRLGLRRSTSRPVRSRLEIIRRLDIGCVKGV